MLMLYFSYLSSQCVVFSCNNYAYSAIIHDIFTYCYFRIRATYYDPLLRHAYYNSSVFKVLRAAYNRILYQKGDRKNTSVRKYCDWLEQQNSDIFNREKLPKSDGDDSQAPVVAPSGDGDTVALKTEESAGTSEASNTPVSEKKTARTSLKMPPPPPLSIKAGSRTRKSIQSTPTASESTDDKSKAEATKPIFMYRPPTSRLKPLPNAKRRAPVETSSPVKTPVKTTIPATTTPSKQKQTSTANTPVKTNVTVGLMPSPVAQVKTYGPAKSTTLPMSANAPAALSSVVPSIPIIATSTIITSPLSSINPPTPSSMMITSPATAAPASSALPVQLPAGLNPSSQQRHVLIARRNLTGPLVVSGGVPQNVMGQKSQPIVIRNVPSNQLQSSGTTSVLQNPIQIPTSTVQLAVSGAGGTGGVAILNLRGNMGSLVRSVQGLGPQVVRLLQQQGLQLVQQQPLQQSGMATSGNPNLPVTVRLPVSTMQINQNPTSAALCSTASAIVAANSSAVRLAARAGAGGAIQVVSSRPLTGTNTVVARGAPIPASVVTTGSRLAKPTMATVRSPGGAQMRPTTITGVRTTTLTASQLRTALSQGLVRTTPGTVQGTVVASGAPLSTNVSTVRTSGAPISAIRTISIPTSTLAGVTMTRPQIIHTTMASSIASGMRPVQINAGVARAVPTTGVRGMMGNANTMTWQQQIVSSAPPGARLVTVPMQGNMRQQTASSLVAAASSGAIRIRRNMPPGSTAPTTLLMPIPRQSVASHQGLTIASSIPSSGGLVSVGSSPIIVSEGSTSGMTTMKSNFGTTMTQPTTSTVVTLSGTPVSTGTVTTPVSSAPSTN